MAPPLLPIFRSRLQGDLLALVLGTPDQEWTIEALATATGHPYQTVSNELRRLEAGGLLVGRTVGRAKFLRADTTNPYLPPLSQLVLMSFGPPLVLAEEFSGVDGVDEILLFGSWAARYSGEPGPPPRDVDVLVIGTPDRDALHEAARRAEGRLHREVNVTLRSRERWKNDDDGFTRQLRRSPLVRLTGGSDPATAEVTHR
ncbi:MAG: ArsR family transcriptional regulator [Kineosporiaceae bacterium]